MKRKIVLAVSGVLTATLAFFGVKAMVHKSPVTTYWYKLSATGACTKGTITCTTVNTNTPCVSGAVAYFSTSTCQPAQQIAAIFKP